TLNGTIPEQAVIGQFKLTAGYDIRFIPGLTVTGGVYHTGGIYADQANTQFVPGRTTGDVGLRFATRWSGHAIIARFVVSNATDESFWLGAVTVGDPRRFNLSLQAIL